MVKNVIFDIGRVMIRYEPEEYLQKLGYADEKVSELMASVFLNDLWVELDRGTYSLGEGVEMLCEMYPELESDIRIVMRHDNLLPIFTLMESSLEFFMEVKNAGYKIYILSNYSAEGFTDVRRRYSFFNEADGIVVSSYVHMVKPDKEIFAYIKDRYALDPNQTVFIDDNRDNIKTANDMGFNTILFTDIESCRAEFDRIAKM